MFFLFFLLLCRRLKRELFSALFYGFCSFLALAFLLIPCRLLWFLLCFLLGGWPCSLVPDTGRAGPFPACFHALILLSVLNHDSVQPFQPLAFFNLASEDYIVYLPREDCYFILLCSVLPLFLSCWSPARMLMGAQ